MIIGYARISTKDQKIALQIDALKAAGCARIYRDKGYSGLKTKRPGLDRMLKALKPGDTLMIWKLDRLARSVRHLCDLSEWMLNEDIIFRSLSDSISTQTASGKFFFHILSAVAEFESALISERTIAGMAAAKARGVHVGRPSTLHSPTNACE